MLKLKSLKKKIVVPLVGLAIVLAVIGLFFLLSPRDYRINYKNYPFGAYKVPEEILKERIATQSAVTYRIPIIMYHYVEYVEDKNDKGRINLTTVPSVLKHQIVSLLDNHYNFYFVRDLPDILSGKNPLLPRPVVLTFDDGYEDFYGNVLPLLKKYNVKATLFVMSNYIGRKGYLTIGEIEALIKSGYVEIGSHTLDHAYLKGMKGPLAWKEIHDDKDQLENLFNIKILSFAYPYGAFDKPAVDYIKQLGFTSAVSVVPGVNQSKDNLFYLFRIRPGFLWGLNPAKMLESYGK